MNLLRRLLRLTARIAFTALLGGLLGATLIRFAPGFQFDERQLDPRFSQQRVESFQADRSGEQNVLRFYAGYLSGVLRGNLGESRTFRRPVTSLFFERIPVTMQSIALGLALAWSAGLALAIPAAGRARPSYEMFTSILSGLLLSLPSAVIALLLLYLNGPVSLALALVVLPRVFRYARNLIVETQSMPHVVLAAAKGVSKQGILVRHVMPIAAPQLLALAGVSISMALGAAIPIEVICDSPGVGQLAWQAALGRDLPLLVNVTLLIALVTLIANCAAELTAKSFERQPA
jgi:peptide/nickel transport system permease protein